MAENKENITRCPVCASGYKDKGERTPKLLPCCHSVCEGCIDRKLLRKGHLDCPQCGIPHMASKGVESFPTNIYIIIYMNTVRDKHNSGNLKGINNSENINGVHEVEDLDISFCSLCCTRGCVHSEKEDADAEKQKSEETEEEMKEQKRNLLVADILYLKKRLQANKEELVAAHNKAMENYQFCTDEINKKKIEMMVVICERADELVKEVAEQRLVMNDIVNDAVAKIDESLTQLSCVSEAVNRDVPHQDVADELCAVNDIRSQLENNLAKVNVFYFCLVFILRVRNPLAMNTS